MPGIAIPQIIILWVTIVLRVLLRLMIADMAA
jgi:hypothetical protein